MTINTSILAIACRETTDVPNASARESTRHLGSSGRHPPSALADESAAPALDVEPGVIVLVRYLRPCESPCTKPVYRVIENTDDCTDNCLKLVTIEPADCPNECYALVETCGDECEYKVTVYDDGHLYSDYCPPACRYDIEHFSPP